jgi:chromosome segregation ATPase
MAESAHGPGLPEVRLEVRHGPGRPTTYAVADVDFLVGSVPGCDLRVPGAGLPPVLCLISRRPGGAGLRKLAPTLPLTVNGRPVSSADLAEGDRIGVGKAELVVHVQAVDPPAAPPSAGPSDAELAALRRQMQEQEESFCRERERLQAAGARRAGELEEQAGRLEARRKELEEQTAELEANRVYWYQRREEVERECRRQTEAVALARKQLAQREAAQVPLDLRRREQAADDKEQELAGRQSELDGRAAELDRQRQEMARLRQELADIRRELYDRYQERRDRLSGLQEAVNRAARKVQERKQQLEAEAREVKAHRQENDSHRAELETRAADLGRQQQQLVEERHAAEERRQAWERQLAERLAECRAREEQLAADRQALEDGQKQHQADLVRLDRWQAGLEQRDKDLQERTADLERRLEQLQADTQEMEQQVVQLDEWHAKLSGMAGQIEQQKAEQDAEGAKLAQRAATLEGQQAMLAGLRTRLERMRDEVRAEEQQLAAERARVQSLEQGVQERLAEAEKLRKELEEDRALRDHERRQMGERSALLETAVAQLRQGQERVAADEERVRTLAVEVEAREAEHREALSLVEARVKQCEDLQQRLEAERQSLRERGQLLTQAEQAREALQEQLRRRSEELAARQKAIAEQARQCEAAAAEMESRRAGLEARERQIEEQAASVGREIEERAQALAGRQEVLERREQVLAQNLEKLKEAGRAVGGERKAMLEEKARLAAQRQDVERATAQARADFEAAKREAVALQRVLPDLELRAGTAFERLSFARDQLKEHIQEVHAYAGQCQEDLEAVRRQVQGEGERLQEREQALRKAQDEQRLAVAAFRQQLLAWQGQLAEMKRLLAQGETRLERRHAQVAEQARHVDAESVRLARQAEQLQQQERAVEEQRAEVGRHLNDMRDWYRRKLRELAGIEEADAVGAGAPAARPAAETDDDAPLVPVRRDILSLTGDLDPADRKLGEQLQALGLIDADTLTALLVEARRQRRSLRQVLLAGGTVTLYQMALMEAGDLDGLMLGPVRVVDRLRATPQEMVYRVFDPRRGREAVLRHLAESEMHDAVRPDEYRQRFGQAVLSHPNVAGTLEVLEVAGRPAVLQEWLTGLPDPDWPPHLAAAPGVWLRLVTQAALGLHAAHEAGLAHGHLRPGHLLLTGDGVVKVCGFGEPPWLAPQRPAEAPDDPAADLLALGRIASCWVAAAGKRKAGKAKLLPEGLQAVHDRLCAEDPATRYGAAAVLLDDLDRAGADVPANAEAWDRLLRHVRENAVAEGGLRASA